MFDVNDFEKMPVEECVERFDWGYDGKPGTIAYHGSVGGFEIFVDELGEGVFSDADVFACEVYDADGGMVAGEFAETPADAVRAALVAVVGPEALDEGNSEDAVNACAFGAFQTMFGRMPEHNEDMEEMDALFAHAVKYVKAHAESAGFEWEDAWA